MSRPKARTEEPSKDAKALFSLRREGSGYAVFRTEIVDGRVAKESRVSEPDMLAIALAKLESVMTAESWR